jgi:hypothetical protein
MVTRQLIIKNLQQRLVKQADRCCAVFSNSVRPLSIRQPLNSSGIVLMRGNQLIALDQGVFYSTYAGVR